MAPNQLLRINRQQPFVPFRLYLSDGAAYEVRHPDQLMLGGWFAFLGLPASDQPGGLFDRWVNFDPLHVVRVEPIAPSQTQAAS